MQFKQDHHCLKFGTEATLSSTPTSQHQHQHQQPRQQQQQPQTPPSQPSPSSSSSSSSPLSLKPPNQLSAQRRLSENFIVYGKISRRRHQSLYPLVLYYFLLMSLFYQVMGATRCPKIKKHAGIKLRPINKAKEPFTPGDMLIYSCESTEFTQSIKCLDDGRWTDFPHCPDPSNNTCPDLSPILNGAYNATGPFKVGTVVAFRCDNELISGNLNTTNSNVNNNNSKKSKEDSSKSQGSGYTLPTTTLNANINEVDAIAATTLATPRPITSWPSNFGGAGSPLPISDNGNGNTLAPNTDAPLANSLALSQADDNSPTPIINYNLNGHRILKCLPSSKWNHPQPTCSPVLPEPPSNLNILLTSAFLIIIPILIIIAIVQLSIRWRKKQQQRKRWKQYFTDYKYRHSKTSITFGMRPQNSNAHTIPVTDL